MYIFLGAIAFVFLFFFDVYTLNNKSTGKRLFGSIGLTLLIFSAIIGTITSSKIELPLTLRIFSSVLWIISTFLLTYSLFLELPFVKTYGNKIHSNELVSTGTYALCRHPGVLWFGFMFFFFFFTTGATFIIYAGILWTIIDVLHVYFQEKLFFHKMFPEYISYVKTTPMLIPTGESFKKCIKTIFKKEA